MRLVGIWQRSCRLSAGLVSVFLLAACASGGVNLGLSLPIGPHVGVGVVLGSDGRVGASMGVGAGAASVSVGTSGRLPQATDEPDPSAPVAAQPR